LGHEVRAYEKKMKSMETGSILPVQPILATESGNCCQIPIWSNCHLETVFILDFILPVGTFSGTAWWFAG
jgi:hypothetical protein